jgi:hypothetical protein
MTQYLSWLRHARNRFFENWTLQKVRAYYSVGKPEMRRKLALVLLLGFITTSVLAQSRLTGKWETDRSADTLSTTVTRRNQSVNLEVAIEADRASGTLALNGLGGTFYLFQDGKVTGNKVRFRPDSNPALPIWTIEMVDDNTVMLYHDGLPLVGSNVLGLISAMGATPQPVSPVLGPDVSSPSVSSSLRGAIQDQSKARIPGVTITVMNVDTSAKLTTTTNDAGLYRFTGLAPGNYTLTASLSGFKSATVRSLKIGDGDVLENLTLEFSTPIASPTAAASSCSRR